MGRSAAVLLLTLVLGATLLRLPAHMCRSVLTLALALQGTEAAVDVALIA